VDNRITATIYTAVLTVTEIKTIKTMKKYRIELSEEQLRLVANCLEDVSRFAAGQHELRFTIEEMSRHLPFDEFIKRRDDAEYLLFGVKRVLLPELQNGESKSYNSTEFIGNVYQIYRTILHQLAVDYDWNNVYSSPALPSGKMGTIKVEQVK